MIHRVKDKLFTAVLIIIAIAVIITMLLTLYGLFANDNLQDQIDTNKGNIQRNTNIIKEQEKPCQPEDLRRPEEAAGC